MFKFQLLRKNRACICFPFLPRLTWGGRGDLDSKKLATTADHPGHRHDCASTLSRSWSLLTTCLIPAALRCNAAFGSTNSTSSLGPSYCRRMSFSRVRDGGRAAQYGDKVFAKHYSAQRRAAKIVTGGFQMAPVDHHRARSEAPSCTSSNSDADLLHSTS